MEYIFKENYSLKEKRETKRTAISIEYSIFKLIIVNMTYNTVINQYRTRLQCIYMLTLHIMVEVGQVCLLE